MDLEGHELAGLEQGCDDEMWHLPLASLGLGPHDAIHSVVCLCSLTGMTQYVYHREHTGYSWNTRRYKISFENNTTDSINQY
jgi:hypothetical protein